MDITQIRYFLEVAESQHITESAEKLHIAQPALSRAIHKFEKTMGVKLFEAKGRNIVLNRYGEYLKNKLVPIMEELDSLPEALQTMAKLQGETIHLNVLAASPFVTDAIIQYKSQHKDINFQLLQHNDGEIYDIEIASKAFYNRPKETKDNVFICNEKILLAVPKYGKFKDRTSITLKEIENEGFISLMGSKQFRYICDRFCRQADITPRIIFESDNLTAVHNMIGANMGVGFWPEFTWGDMENDNVKLLEITDPKCSRDIIITYRQNKENSKNTIEFFEYLKDFCLKRKKVSEV